MGTEVYLRDILRAMQEAEVRGHLTVATGAGRAGQSKFLSLPAGLLADLLHNLCDVNLRQWVHVISSIPRPHCSPSTSYTSCHPHPHSEGTCPPFLSRSRNPRAQTSADDANARRALWQDRR